MAMVGVSMSFDLAKVPRLFPLHSSSLTRNSTVFLGAKRIQQARWEGSSRRTATMSVNARFGSTKGGAGLVEPPSFDQSLLEPMTQVKKVAQILPQVDPSVTMVGAMKLFNESRGKRTPVVIVTVMEHAEFYSYMLNRKGLQSLIELDDSKKL